MPRGVKGSGTPRKPRATKKAVGGPLPNVDATERIVQPGDVIPRNHYQIYAEFVDALDSVVPIGEPHQTYAEAIKAKNQYVQSHTGIYEAYVKEINHADV